VPEQEKNSLQTSMGYIPQELILRSITIISEVYHCSVSNSAVFSYYYTHLHSPFCFVTWKIWDFFKAFYV